MQRIIRLRAAACTLCLCGLLAATGVAGAQQAAGPATATPVRQLVAVLQSDAPVYDKAMACRALSVSGDATAVAALAPLLADPQLAAYARSALETIADPAAAAALREALGQLEGELLIGVLDSIGNLRDAAAVDAVATHLQDDDAAIAAAAARTLGHIGNAQTAQQLRQALDGAADQRQPAIAMACLVNADLLLQQPDQQTTAVALYDAVMAAEIPDHLRLAATQRRILAQDEQALPLLEELLAADDSARFRLALQTARQLGADASPLLIKHYPQLPAERQALTVLALADIGDPQSLTLLREAAKSSAPATRVQAIAALAKMNDAGSLDLLVAASADSDPQVAAAAREALSQIRGERVDRVIAERLSSNDPRTLLAAIDVAQHRRAASATPALLNLADHDDPAIRAAAVRALGGTAGIDHLGRIIQLAISASDPQVRTAAGDALAAAGARLPPDESVAQLTAAMQEATGDARVMLLEQIAGVGGPEALVAVTRAAQQGDDSMRDAATRLLGEWLSADAAPHLLQLAKGLDDPKYKVRALRGYIRCARQLDMTPQQRLEVCRNVLEVADRKEEKLLVFEVLRRYPSVAGLRLATALLTDPQLRDAAAQAILGMTGSVAADAPQAARDALQALSQSAAAPALRQQAQQQLQQP